MEMPSNFEGVGDLDRHPCGVCTVLQRFALRQFRRLQNLQGKAGGLASVDGDVHRVKAGFFKAELLEIEHQVVGGKKEIRLIETFMAEGE